MEKKQKKNVSENKKMKKNVGDSGNADGEVDGGKKDIDDSVTLDEWNEFEAEDSSTDYTYVPMDDEDSDNYDGIEDIDGFNPKNVYKNYPNKTSATTFCASNVRDEFEMTASQESELPIEPTDKFETTSTFEGFDTLSDEDGDETDLFERHTRFYSKKETKDPEEIEDAFTGEETVTHGITWKVKFNIKKKIGKAMNNTLKVCKFQKVKHGIIGTHHFFFKSLFQIHTYVIWFVIATINRPLSLLVKGRIPNL